MPRQFFFAFVAITAVGLALTLLLQPTWSWWWLPLIALCAVGFGDLRSRHNVLRIYPIIGHLRFMLEFIRPELRQYFFESEQSGRPFNREQRTLIYARARGEPDTQPFGTVHDVHSPGFDLIEHSMAPASIAEEEMRVMVGNEQTQQPYDASRLNISAMSFGSLSGNAVLALNKGAKLGGFAQDTGEGAISPYHLEGGGSLIWELGTAYFGCRRRNGRFNPDEFRDRAQGETVRMIEIKLSQGAKPSHGGLLPAAKINAEIARTRQIDQGEACVSPATHPEFDTPTGLLEFLARLRGLSGGKPTGFKLCLGRRSEFMGICKAMLSTGIIPDFITVDGAEGGTGAAPTEFSAFVGTYINEAVPFVHNCLRGIGVREQVRVIASGKIAMGFDVLTKIALGADMCNAARPFMFSVGCIQARRCHTNNCPSGVATQDPRRAQAVDTHAKAPQVRNYHHRTLDAFRDLAGAAGARSVDELNASMIYHRTGHAPATTYRALYPPVASKSLVHGDTPHWLVEPWQRASADRF